MLSLGEKLKQQEDQLRKLMAEYRQTKNPDLLAEIESRLDELKATYQEFLSSMAQLNQTADGRVREHGRARAERRGRCHAETGAVPAVGP